MELIDDSRMLHIKSFHEGTYIIITFLSTKIANIFYSCIFLPLIQPLNIIFFTNDNTGEFMKHITKIFEK